MHVTPKMPPTGGEGVRPEGAVPFGKAEKPLPFDSFRDVFERLSAEVDSGERVVRTALRESPFADDARGMIALQASVYRYVEAVELCTKLVDRASGAVRTTLQSQ